jgi:hypothetical protein
MNITDAESPVAILAKTCGCREREKNTKVTYFFIDSCHTLCLDKGIYDQIEACNRLSRYTRDEGDTKVIEKEITDLRMSLDLIN